MKEREKKHCDILEKLASLNLTELFTKILAWSDVPAKAINIS